MITHHIAIEFLYVFDLQTLMDRRVQGQSSRLISVEFQLIPKSFRLGSQSRSADSRVLDAALPGDTRTHT